MYWTLELASKLEDAPWPATRDELIDFAIRSGAPLEVTENLQEIEEEGEIYIALKKELDKQYVLNIGDNGVGFPETINYKNTKSLGLKLIHNLTRQLKGTIQRDVSKKGTNYIIKFQEVKQQLAPAI